jgi:hypothetical protein
MGSFFQKLNRFAVLSRWSKSRKSEKPLHSLSQKAHAQITQEASFLKSHHRVEVRELAIGEEAGPPKPAGSPPPSQIS